MNQSQVVLMMPRQGCGQITVVHILPRKQQAEQPFTVSVRGSDALHSHRLPSSALHKAAGPLPQKENTDMSMYYYGRKTVWTVPAEICHFQDLGALWVQLQTCGCSGTGQQKTK